MIFCFRTSFPVLEHPFPVLERLFPVLEHLFPVLEHRFPVLERLFPVLEHPFPVLERLFPVLERPFPVFLFFWEAYFVPGRDGTEEFVPGHLLLPLSRPLETLICSLFNVSFYTHVDISGFV